MMFRSLYLLSYVMTTTDTGWCLKCVLILIPGWQNKYTFSFNIFRTAEISGVPPSTNVSVDIKTHLEFAYVKLLLCPL